MTVLYHGVMLCFILAFFVFFTFSGITFGGNAKFVAILIMLLTITTYVALHMRIYDNIRLIIPDHEMVQKKHNTTVIINPKPNQTVISNNYNNSETYSNNNVITKAFDPDVYLFSAFKVRFEEYQYPFDKSRYRVNNKPPTDVIWLNGWQRQSVRGRLFKCCILLKNNTVVEIQSNRRNTQYPSAIRAVQYVCPSVVESNLIQLVTVVLGNKKCPADNKYYVKLNIGPTKRNPKLAICSKLTYDYVDPIPIVEWFEAQRILGVDKVVTYPCRLNANALKVLTYYESVGFLDIINGFDLPEVGEYCFVYLFVWLYFTPLSTIVQWRSVLLIEESGGPRKNHRPVGSH
jgi:hypothetical protein